MAPAPDQRSPSGTKRVALAEVAATGGGEATHKVIITGTGRAGTTVLVQLLTELGLNTGFASTHETVDLRARAGMEWGLANPEAPYVVKSPWLCLNLDKHLQSGCVVIDHAFVPIRDLQQAAASRIAVSAAAGEPDGEGRRLPGGVPGGLWRTSHPERQAEVLAQMLYRLIHVLTVYDIPHTFLDFPRFIRDADYLYRKLSPLLGGIGVEHFRQAYLRVTRPDLVHNFEDDLVDGLRR